MSTSIVIVLAIVVLVVVAIAIWYTQQRRRRAALREQFGPEYAHALREHGGPGEAERELQARAERVEQLHLRQLPAEESARYAQEWRAVQAHFVDDPGQAIAEADRLIGEVMQARGYPLGDFNQRAADISVDHPRVVEHYRAGHALAERSASGEATTEDQRQALVHFRALFEELIETRETAGTEVRR